MSKDKEKEIEKAKNRLLELLYQYYYDCERRCIKPSKKIKTNIATLLIELQKKGVSWKFLDTISKNTDVKAEDLPRLQQQKKN